MSPFSRIAPFASIRFSRSTVTVTILVCIMSSPINFTMNRCFNKKTKKTPSIFHVRFFVLLHASLAADFALLQLLSFFYSIFWFLLRMTKHEIKICQYVYEKHGAVDEHVRLRAQRHRAKRASLEYHLNSISMPISKHFKRKRFSWHQRLLNA